MSPRPIPECGTTAAYQRHHRYREPIDDACREANNAAKREAPARARQRREAEEAAQRAEETAQRLAAEAVELGHPAGYDELLARALREEITGGSR